MHAVALDGRRYTAVGKGRLELTLAPDDEALAVTQAPAAGFRGRRDRASGARASTTTTWPRVWRATATLRLPSGTRATTGMTGRWSPRAATCVWRVDARADIGNDERDVLLAQLRRDLQQGVQPLPASPQGRPAQIRVAITRVETVSPALNTVSSLRLMVPLDRGGAAVEIEAVDPQPAAYWPRFGWVASHRSATSRPASASWRRRKPRCARQRVTSFRC